jgi:hypothetical protein
MSFENEIFEQYCNIWPATSVRSFSKSLGRSEGYWSSLKSQKLHISNGALMNLQTTLSAKELLAVHDEMKIKMRDLQNKISLEMIRRFLELTEEDDGVIEELMKLSERGSNDRYSSNLPLPFLMSIY